MITFYCDPEMLAQLKYFKVWLIFKEKLKVEFEIPLQNAVISNHG